MWFVFLVFLAVVIMTVLTIGRFLIHLVQSPFFMVIVVFVMSSFSMPCDSFRLLVDLVAGCY